ncbi:hypothetical protein EDI_123960 [Entamoeba dispar SAW760]|uniref:Uncharacterized protein n=1 Tax=Entamoeba dispar (strain ATCC PRA-260 / SAW760) TaxID=370354 RepID=B0ER22_ENTDS|nr:uncharacterized protein EDI_123960 [Entamoeba dispar SAW760]EDR23031.1 hypothetical protein EDI_123960 [Entamoeba dispar SAW760]|eukprot:EDR23031.1 hypothetical protein EDI_123960 [Entamoeba dispar SAW760]
MLLFVLFITAYAITCNQAIDAGNIDENSYTNIIQLDSTTTNSTFGCSSNNIFKQPAYQIKFTATKAVSLTTCFKETTLNSRLILTRSCQSGTNLDCPNAKELSNPRCSGQHNDLLLEPEEGVTYYLIIAGTSAQEQGSVKISIESTSTIDNSKCSLPQQINIPTTIRGVFDANNHNYNSYQKRRGFWYKFVATKESVYINACNKFTTIESEIFLFNQSQIKEENNCQDSSYFAFDNHGCGFQAKLSYHNLTIGETYFMFICSWKDGNEYVQNGNYEVTISDTPAAQTCETSYSITNIPVSLSFKVTGIEVSNSLCENSEKGRGIYLNVRGDGKRYAMHTCASNSVFSSSDRIDTFIELFKGDCSSCVTQETNNCGNDGLIAQSNAKITDYTEVRFKMMEMKEKENYKCSNSTEIDLRRLGNFYSQIVDASEIPESESGCDETLRKKQGTWYSIKSIAGHTKVIAGVIPNNPNEYAGLLEIRNSCSVSDVCEQHSGIASFVMKKEDSLLKLFATAQRTGGQGEPYGVFMFFAAYIDMEQGTSIENAIEITLPFTEVRVLGLHKIPSLCYGLDNVAGVYYKFKGQPFVEYTLNSCGDETTQLTTVEMDGHPTSWNGCYEVSQTVACGMGGTQVKVLLNTRYKDDTAIASMWIPPSTGNKGIARFNIFESQSSAPNERCDKAEEIKLPATRYFYNEINSKSRSTCTNPAVDGLLGNWFVITAPENKTLLVFTDDVSAMKTRIEIYESCKMVTSDSVGQNCLSSETVESNPRGVRGTTVIYPMKKGETVYIFVGGMSSSDVGVGRVDFEFIEDYSPNDSTNDTSEEDNGLSGGAIFGILIAVIILLVILIITIGLIIFLIIKKKKTSTQSSYGGI